MYLVYQNLFCGTLISYCKKYHQHQVLHQPEKKRNPAFPINTDEKKQHIKIMTLLVQRVLPW